MVRAIVLNADDNVATLIDRGGEAEMAVDLRGERKGSVSLRQDVPFGHKVALSDMAPGVEVIKYGKVIGETTAEIHAGDHVHVHNVDSQRGRGDKMN